MIDVDGIRSWIEHSTRRLPPSAAEAIEVVAQLSYGDARDLSEKDEPAPMDTLGSLVDKLITVDLKMWHNQEQLYAIRRMTSEDFERRYGPSMSELHQIVKRCCDLNVQRSRLVDAIDAKLAAVVAGDDAIVTAQSHKTY